MDNLVDNLQVNHQASPVHSLQDNHLINLVDNHLDNLVDNLAHSLPVNHLVNL